MRACIILFFCLISFSTFSQKADSLLDAQYHEALVKFKEGNMGAAAIQFTQLINSGFSNKEVFVKRGITLYQQKDFEKAKNDFDEAVKGRINTAELFEYRGNAKYNLNDFQGASTDLEKAVSMGANSFETHSNLGN